jgi:hypothetical protein
LNWNNRPYVSGKELMMVPAGNSASLLREMSLNQSNLYTGNTLLVYQSPLAANGLPASEFAHLPNLFDSPATTPTTGAPAQPSARLNRLLDFIHVPSRFAGTTDVVAPLDAFGASSLPATAPHYLHPPFNQVSRFRDPGKVNINTIYDPAVWQGILDERIPGEASPPWLNSYQAMWGARQGSGTTNPGPLSIFGSGTPAYPTRTALLNAASSAQLPTIFAKPYRSASGNALVPLQQMRQGHAGSDPSEREISSTLLRPDPGQPTFPMFEAPGAPPAASGLFKEYPNAAFVSTQTSPYFAYEEFRRLDNLVTTRSNVYAVWLTMGYFEVTPAPAPTNPTEVTDYPAKYPDGWQLGAEMGADTGDIQRHRAFYIYDRSIPVGFERGENHNVDRGILVQRYIE